MWSHHVRSFKLATIFAEIC